MIRTTKYNIFNFIPKSLFLQLEKHTNIYFVLIGIILIQVILQSIRIISPLTPLTSIMPLCFVLGLSMVREGYETY